MNSFLFVFSVSSCLFFVYFALDDRQESLRCTYVCLRARRKNAHPYAALSALPKLVSIIVLLSLSFQLNTVKGFISAENIHLMWFSLLLSLVIIFASVALLTLNITYASSSRVSLIDCSARCSSGNKTQSLKENELEHGC